MILSRKEFANGLRMQLIQGYDPVRIAQWAYELHLSARAFEAGLESDILQLVAMDMGEEFALEEGTIRELASGES